MRITDTIKQTVQKFCKAVSRFPLTVTCLVSTSILQCYMVSLHGSPDLIIQKLLFTFSLGSFLGVTAQFICERFEQLSKRRLIVYAVSCLLIVGYYLILCPASAISYQVSARTSVAVFAMFCVFMWTPSYKSSYDFSSIALIHFKAVFTAALYSLVLSLGCVSIIATIDALLFKVNGDAYAYMLIIVWVLFATLYYLSLLPRFSDEEDADREYALHTAQYPRYLEILVSYISVPLVAAYTMVLTAYFIKILVTISWPSGLLGGMVLGYSAAGLIIHVLVSPLENRFAVLYRKIFPKVLIPVVIVQLFSVGIRLNAYGVTESRYYIVLFGIFSIVSGILLSFQPVARNGLIAVLAAGFAVFSIIPPVDAFTVSRYSQVSRLESMLRSAGVLVDGRLYPKSNVPPSIAIESTSALFYLYDRGYIKYISWLPADFKPSDMKKVLGFENTNDNINNYFFASIEPVRPLNIQGYDTFFEMSASRNGTQEGPVDFAVRGIEYKLVMNRLSSQEVRVSVQNTAGVELVGTGLYDFAASLQRQGVQSRQSLPPEKMSLKVEKNGFKLLILFKDISISYSDSDASADYNMLIMISAPPS
jgi:hypothetical protein